MIVSCYLPPLRVPPERVVEVVLLLDELELLLEEGVAVVLRVLYDDVFWFCCGWREVELFVMFPCWL